MDLPARISTLQRTDRWIGAPLCAILTLLRRIFEAAGPPGPAAEAGIRIWVPPVEQDLFTEAGELWDRRRAENDYDLSPSYALAKELDKLGKPHKLAVYPPYGASVRDGHGGFCGRGEAVWGPDVLAFLEAALKN